MRDKLLSTQYNLGLPTIPHCSTKYPPNTWEDILWSTTVVVPRVVIPRLSYRIREDYYKVKEIYTEDNIKVPHERLIGTDVFVSRVEGDFAIIEEYETKIVHRIFYKFLRVLQPGEPFMPNKWVFRRGSEGGLAKRVIAETKAGDLPRFRLSLELNTWKLQVHIIVLRNGKKSYQTYTRSFDNVENAVVEGLAWVIEEYGQYNTSEVSLYDSLITKTTKSHPYIESILNYSK
ncbi:MAG: hypothetical protein ACRCX2_06160 [Paraclostridium sp.]